MCRVYGQCVASVQPIVCLRKTINRQNEKINNKTTTPRALLPRAGTVTLTNFLVVIPSSQRRLLPKRPRYCPPGPDCFRIPLIYDRAVIGWVPDIFFFCTPLLSSFWTSRGHRCRPFSPPVLAFNSYRAYGSAIPLLVDFYIEYYC